MGGRTQDGREAGGKKSPVYTVLATGTSLTEEDARLAHRETTCIVVNDAWRLLPEAPHHYAADWKWWDYHYEAVKAGFRGTSYTIDDAENPQNNPCPDYDLVRLKSRQRPNLDREWIHYGVNGGGNSGFQAINLAYHLGARTVLLLGFDMHGRHFFGDHPEGLHNGSPFDQFIRSFESIKVPDLDIINCTKSTALHCFPKADLASVLSSGPARR